MSAAPESSDGVGTVVARSGEGGDERKRSEGFSPTEGEPDK